MLVKSRTILARIVIVVIIVIAWIVRTMGIVTIVKTNISIVIRVV